MSAGDFFTLGDRVGLWEAHQIDSDAVRAWQDSQREPTGSRGAEDAVEALGAVLRYVADGLSLGNMPERAVSLLVVLRPDLIEGCSYDDLARELSSTEARVADAVAQLRDEFPTLRGGYHPAKKTGRRRFLHGKWRRERLAVQETMRERQLRRAGKVRAAFVAAEDMAAFDRALGIKIE